MGLSATVQTVKSIWLNKYRINKTAKQQNNFKYSSTPQKFYKIFLLKDLTLPHSIRFPATSTSSPFPFFNKTDKVIKRQRAACYQVRQLIASLLCLTKV